MPSEEQQLVKQRISKSQGRVMVGVGVLFDLSPLLLVFLAILIIATGFGGFFGKSALRNAGLAAEACAEAEAITVERWSQLGRIYDKWRLGNACHTYKGFAKNDAILAGASAVVFGGAFGFALGPIVYIAGTYLSVIMAQVVFWFWFMFNGVNIWNIGKANRVIANLLGIIVESVPIVNLLPGMTLMVWRHVKITQTEDKLREKEAQMKQLRVIQGGGGRRRYAKAV